MVNHLYNHTIFQVVRLERLNMPSDSPGNQTVSNSQNRQQASPEQIPQGNAHATQLGRLSVRIPIWIVIMISRLCALLSTVTIHIHHCLTWNHSKSRCHHHGMRVDIE